MFEHAGIKGEEKGLQCKHGSLALNLDWTEELESQDKSDDIINDIVNAQAPNLDIAIQTEGEDNSKAQTIIALLMSPEVYLVALFAGKPAAEAELKQALAHWNIYFKALQQHQYVLGEQFSIKLLSSSDLPKAQQALTQVVRGALQGNVETNELLQQFEGFNSVTKPVSWAQLVNYSLCQVESLKSAKRESEEKASLLKKSNSEKEAFEKTLKEQREGSRLLTLQVQQLQEELDTSTTEANNSKATIVELTQQNSDSNNKLAKANEENKALISDNSEQKSENELLLLQVQQLQEELETVFAEAQGGKAALTDLESKYNDISRQLADTNTEKQNLTKINSEQAEENALLLLQIQQLQEELETVFAEAQGGKAALTDLESKYNDIGRQLADTNTEKQNLTKINSEQAEENALLLLQIQQLQEELEATFTKLTERQGQLSLLEQTHALAKEDAKSAESALNSTLANKLSAVEDENSLLVLQINQLQEELESIYVKSEEQKNTSAELTKTLEAKLLHLETNTPDLRKELENAMSEQELLQLQIKQLQEELEFYFTEYQKLKGESPDNKALAEFKSKVEERYPHLVLSEGVTLTGGANQKDLKRITARFTQVEHGDKHWNAFSIIVNDRKGVLDIELHAPDKKRVYPLSKFVKTGSNKVCDFSLLSPFTDAGKKALAELPAEDHLLLVGIIEELQTKLKQGDIERTDATANLDVAAWPQKLLTLTSALKQLAPKQAPKPLNFKKLSLQQNMVGATNEHLLICVEDLQANGISYPAFDIKVGAKQIKDSLFTEYGSLEFRELANKQAPLATWPPATEDKWGLKLVLDLPSQLNEEQQKAIDSLQEQDKLFIKALLSKLADRLHTLDRKKLKVNQPLENWQKLLTGMSAKF
jgi:myosin heavy subunit